MAPARGRRDPRAAAGPRAGDAGQHRGDAVQDVVHDGPARQPAAHRPGAQHGHVGHGRSVAGDRVLHQAGHALHAPGEWDGEPGLEEVDDGAEEFEHPVARAEA